LEHIKLTQSLKAEELRKIDEIQNSAEKKVQQLKTESEKELEEIRFLRNKEIETEFEIKRKEEISRAKRDAKEKTLKAESVLEEKIFGLAKKIILEQAEEHQNLFEKLADEIPKTKYDEIWVNNKDEEKAKKLFSLTKVQTDKNIMGGLKAFSETFEADNTLETRLFTAKTDIIRKVMQQIHEKYEKTIVT